MLAMLTMEKVENLVVTQGDVDWSLLVSWVLRPGSVARVPLLVAPQLLVAPPLAALDLLGRRTLQAAGCRLQAAGCWLQTADCTRNELLSLSGLMGGCARWLYSLYYTITQVALLGLFVARYMPLALSP